MTMEYHVTDVFHCTLPAFVPEVKQSVMRFAHVIWVTFDMVCDINTQFGTPNLVQWGHSYLSPSQRRGHLVVIVTGSPRKGGFKESLQYGHVHLCEVTVGCVYHGEVSEECSKVGYHALYCTGSLEVKLVEQKILLDHYQFNNAHWISWRAE